MEKAISADGTAIAYDTRGTGPLAVVVGGAFNDRGTWAGLATELADLGFTGVSSGAALLLRAVAAGLPVERISVFEPPYRVPGSPPPPPDYMATLQRYVDADDRDGLVTYFQTQAVGLPEPVVQSFKSQPMWPALCAMAPTLVHDGWALGGDDHSFPTELLASVRVPVLAVTSSGTASWLGGTAEVVAGALPDARFVRLDGGFHHVPDPVLAPVLADFYRGTGSAV